MITRCRQKVPGARKIFAGWNVSVSLHSISAPDVASGLTGLPGLTADRRRNLNRGLQLIHSAQITYRADFARSIWNESCAVSPFLFAANGDPQDIPVGAQRAKPQPGYHT